jgi:hypothetical protein
MSKFTSRKFWISVAAFLASIATSISGLAAANDKIVIAGVICGMLSAAIYAAAEAYVDSANVSASTTQKVITATTNSREVAQAALTDTPVVASEPAKE